MVLLAVVSADCLRLLSLTLADVHLVSVRLVLAKCGSCLRLNQQLLLHEARPQTCQHLILDFSSAFLDNLPDEAVTDVERIKVLSKSKHLGLGSWFMTFSLLLRHLEVSCEFETENRALLFKCHQTCASCIVSQSWSAACS